MARIKIELAEAGRRARAIAAAVQAADWVARPSPDEWSVAECLIHLNMTSRAFLPLIEDAIRRGRDQGLVGRKRERMDLVGRLLWWIATLRVPIKTTEAFVPARNKARDAVVSEFDALQNQLIGHLGDAAELDLTKLRIASPFDPHLKYNLYSCLRLIPAHQRQHLTQAEAVVDRLRASAGGAGTPSGSGTS